MTEHTDPRIRAEFRPGVLNTRHLDQQALNNIAAARRADIEAAYRRRGLDIPPVPDDAFSVTHQPPLSVYVEDGNEDGLRTAQGIINGVMISAAIITVVGFFSYLFWDCM